LHPRLLGFLRTAQLSNRLIFGKRLDIGHGSSVRTKSGS
jgi:hypothetical protein